MPKLTKFISNCFKLTRLILRIQNPPVIVIVPASAIDTTSANTTTSAVTQTGSDVVTRGSSIIIIGLYSEVGIILLVVSVDDGSSDVAVIV